MINENNDLKYKSALDLNLDPFSSDSDLSFLYEYESLEPFETWVSVMLIS